MASLFPIIAVLILAMYVSQTTSLMKLLYDINDRFLGNLDGSIWLKTPREIGGVQAMLLWLYT